MQMQPQTHIATLIADLSKRSPLTPATVVVPSAHSGEVIFRNIALKHQNTGVLFGARFITLPGLIGEIRALQGLDPHLDSGYHLRFRLRSIFLNSSGLPSGLPSGLSSGGGLRYFDAEQLGEGNGYAEAFARTLTELDLATPDPQSLTTQKKTASGDRIADLVKIRECAFPEGTPPSLGQALRELTGLLKSSSAPHALAKKLQKALGSVHFLTTGFEPALASGFSEALVGACAGSSIIPISTAPTLEAGLSHIAAPEALLEEWAGVEGERRSTLAWITEQCQRSGDATNPDIAVLAPAGELPALRRYLTYELPESFLFSPGGTPATETPEGVRLLALLDALDDNLSCETLIHVLPHLKAELPEGVFPFSRNKWISAIHSTGTLGRTDWTARLPVREPKTLPYQPALKAVVALWQGVEQNAALAAITEGFSEFCEAHLKRPVEGYSLSARLRETLAEISGNAAAKSIRGRDAIELIRMNLESLTVNESRLAEARVFLGTPEQAAGLPFRAVRWVGLVEGSFPSTPREDAILPDEHRKALGLPGLHTSRTRIERQRHALLSVLAFQPEALAFSCSRENEGGSERAHSSLFVDIQSALPKGKESLRNALRKNLHQNRERLQELRKTNPRTRRDHVAALRKAGLEKTFQPLPKSWPDFGEHSPAFELEGRLQGLSKKKNPGSFEAEDLVSPSIPAPMPGLDPAKPLHPSTIGALLECPHRFFLKECLGWSEPDALLERGELPAFTRGHIVHRALERLYLKHDAAAVRSMKPGELEREVDILIRDFFDRFGETAFLDHPDQKENELRALQDAALVALKVDQQAPIERVEPEVKIEAVLRLRNQGALHIKGSTDRVDRMISAKGRAPKFQLIDYKTGRGKNEDHFLPHYDIQLVVYALSLVSMGRFQERELEALEFRYPENPRHPKREYTGPRLDALIAAGKEWLALIHDILDQRFFTRTTDPENCRYCDFRVICGTKGHEETRKKLETSAHPVAQKLLELWGSGETES
jgi:CRISPR/Cas system-associated exonuclease Cas4 (RecB family)